MGGLRKALNGWPTQGAKIARLFLAVSVQINNLHWKQPSSDKLLIYIRGSVSAVALSQMKLR